MYVSIYICMYIYMYIYLLIYVHIYMTGFDLKREREVCRATGPGRAAGVPHS